MSSSSAAAAGAPSSADDRVYRAVAAGGSVDEGATDDDWFEAVFWCALKNDLAALRRLIECGASVNTPDKDGCTLLMIACDLERYKGGRRDVTLEIFRHSSAETRRAVDRYGSSAIDYLIGLQNGDPLEPWGDQMTGELLAADAPVQPDNAAFVLPIAATHAALREAELAACLSMAHDWRAHYTCVGLSLDVGELREAERAVAERRARLAALEQELGNETDGGSEEGEATGGSGGSHTA